MADGGERLDARRDAEALASPLASWARFGFLRGFSGMRKEILPDGAVVLPSKAFSVAAARSLSAMPADDPRLDARKLYVSEVEETLRGLQTEAVEAHYRNTIWGHVCDLAMALVFVALMAALIVEVGPYSKLTIGLLALIAAKIIFLQYSVRRAVRIAERAFMVSDRDIGLPWDPARP